MHTISSVFPMCRSFLHSHCYSFYSVILTGAFILSSVALPAQAFQKLYINPDSAFFIAYDLCSDITEGYFITGAVQITQPQTFLMKSNLDGTPAWCKLVTSSDPTYHYTTGESVRRTSDNGLIISGLKIAGAVESGGVLVKTNSSGAVSWARRSTCLWESTELCTGPNSIFYASEGKNVRKVFMGRLNNQGQSVWQQWLETGEMDFYNVQSIVRCANGDIVVALLVAKLENGTNIGQNQTILVRMNEDGDIQQASLFPFVHLAALVPLSDGRIAFRCSASDITWTGMGIMDSQFNWLWFKRARFGLTPFLSNLVGQEMAISGDETRVTGIFYTPGGEKTGLTFDLSGNLLQEEVYATNTLAQAAAAAPSKGYIRVANSTASTFTITRSYDDGTVFANCFFPNPCGLELEDGTLAPQSVLWQTTPATCMQDESAVTTNLEVGAVDHCIEVGTVNADFQMNDTIIGAGGSINFRRNSGAIAPIFGTSNWSFEGAVPASGSGPAVPNVRYNQPGSYTVRHIYTVAGCRDTSYLTVTVITGVSIDLGADTTVCSGNGIQLSAGNQSGATYQWNTGATSSNINATQSGTYAVTVTVAGGCTINDVIQVRVLSEDDVALGPDTLICNNGSIRLKASDNANGSFLRWSTGEASQSITVSSPGLYGLELSEGSCLFSDTILVEAKDCNGCQVYTGNIFAPESGHNFQLVPGCTLLSGYLRIYDRWGNLLFETFDPGQGWDGRVNGKLLTPGVYMYTAELQLEEPQKPVETRRISGSITLVR